MSYKSDRRSNDDEPREMHKVTCADCGNETEVPFKPDGVRPVYCRDCYQKRKPARNFDRRSQQSSGPRRRQ